MAGKYTFSLSLSLSPQSLSSRLLSVFSSFLLHAIIIIFFSQSPCLALLFPFFFLLCLACFPFLPVCLSTLSSWLSPPHLSVFLLLCLCASFMGRNGSVTHERGLIKRGMWGSFLFPFKDIFLHFCSAVAKLLFWPQSEILKNENSCNSGDNLDYYLDFSCNVCTIRLFSLIKQQQNTYSVYLLSWSQSQAHL